MLETVATFVTFGLGCTGMTFGAVALLEQVVQVHNDATFNPARLLFASACIGFGAALLLVH